MTERKGSSRPGAKKKAYRKPALRVHGDIRAITRTKGSTKTDSSGLPKTKATGTTA